MDRTASACTPFRAPDLNRRRRVDRRRRDGRSPPRALSVRAIYLPSHLPNHRSPPQELAQRRSMPARGAVPSAPRGWAGRRRPSFSTMTVSKDRDRSRGGTWPGIASLRPSRCSSRPGPAQVKPWLLARTGRTLCVARPGPPGSTSCYGCSRTVSARRLSINLN